jgi:hypothetical protein
MFENASHRVTEMHPHDASHRVTEMHQSVAPHRVTEVPTLLVVVTRRSRWYEGKPLTSGKSKHALKVRLWLLERSVGLPRGNVGVESNEWFSGVDARLGADRFHFTQDVLLTSHRSGFGADGDVQVSLDFVHACLAHVNSGLCKLALCAGEVLASKTLIRRGNRDLRAGRTRMELRGSVKLHVLCTERDHHRWDSWGGAH